MWEYRSKQHKSTAHTSASVVAEDRSVASGSVSTAVLRRRQSPSLQKAATGHKREGADERRRRVGTREGR